MQRGYGGFSSFICMIISTGSFFHNNLMSFDIYVPTRQQNRILLSVTVHKGLRPCLVIYCTLIELIWKLLASIQSF